MQEQDEQWQRKCLCDVEKAVVECMSKESVEMATVKGAFGDEMRFKDEQISALAIELQTASRTNQDRIADIEIEHHRQVDKLNDINNNLGRRNSEDLHRLTQSAKHGNEQLIELHGATVAKLNQAHSEELHTLRHCHQNILAQHNQIHTEELQRLQQEQQGHISQVQATHQEHLKSLRLTHSQLLEQQQQLRKSELSTCVDEQRELFEQKLAFVEDESKAKDDAIKEAQMSFERADNMHRQNVQALELDLMKQFDSAIDDKDRLNRKLQQDIKDLLTKGKEMLASKDDKIVTLQHVCNLASRISNLKQCHSHANDLECSTLKLNEVLEARRTSENEREQQVT